VQQKSGIGHGSPVTAPRSITRTVSCAETPNGFTQTIDAEAVSRFDLWAEIVAAAALARSR
jgi:hypothetical protein